jgi:hypothetical protein
MISELPSKSGQKLKNGKALASFFYGLTDRYRPESKRLVCASLNQYLVKFLAVRGLQPQGWSYVNDIARSKPIA